MLIRLRDLSSLSARGADDATHRVVDLLTEREAPRITHVVTRLGGLFERRGCAIRADAFGRPDLEAGEWPVAVEEGQVEAKGGAVAVLCAPDALPDPADVAAADGTGPLALLSGIDGRPVTGADGARAGTVLDLVIDPEGRRVASLVVNTPGGHQRVVPVEAFERVDWDADDIRLSCGAEPVSASPELHEVGGAIEGHWYNRVMAYYGFG